MWHKFPDEIPPEYKELLIAVVQLEFGIPSVKKDKEVIYHTVASWNYYDGWSLDFAQSRYHSVRYWMEIPKVPPIEAESLENGDEDEKTEKN